MTTLVTGASGFLGSAVVRALLAQTKAPIRCLVRSDAGLPRLHALAEEYGEERIDIYRGDLTRKYDAEEAARGVRTVYHVAAATKGSPSDMFYNSVVGSKNLLEAIKDSGVKRIVLISSFGVYGVAELEPGALVNEDTPLEKHPEQRDPYSHTKHRQEQLFWEYREKHNIPLVVMRPGVIYGPGGAPISTRVGINVFGIFLHLGRNNLIPLTYVDNCAEAIVAAAQHEGSIGEVYNVVDDDLPTSKEFLRQYRRRVRRIKYITLPYFAIHALSGWVEWYNRHSKGQLPAILTPYKTRCNWKGTTFDNSKLKRIGWRPSVSTEEGLKRFFTWLKASGV
jgi:nucleoside-diphosphate-sugar epimerase